MRDIAGYVAAIAGVGIICWPIWDIMTQKPPTGIPEYPGMLVTVQHDGHLFVTRHRAGLVHHPDCPCNQKKP